MTVLSRLLSVCAISVFTLAGAACGKTQPPSESGADRAEPAAAPPAGRGSSQGPKPAPQAAPKPTQGTVQAADYEELKKLLPEVAGWTRSDISGEQLTMPVEYSRASARYRRNDSHIELDITDTGLSQLLLAPLSVFLASGYAERSDDGFKRALKIEEQPSLEDWNAASRRGEVTALVANRFVVKAIGHDVSTVEAVRAVVEAVDFPSLAALR